MPELLTQPSAENPYARYEENYRREKANLFAFAMDKREENDYSSALLGYCGADGDTSYFCFSVGDLFNNYLSKDGKREKTTRMREHVADYRNDFTAMLVDIFGPTYDDFLSPVMVKSLWEEACRMLTDKYGATPYTVKL